MANNTDPGPAPIWNPQHIPEQNDIVKDAHGIPTTPWIIWYQGVDQFIKNGGSGSGYVPYITPQQYGAVGDGTADDSVAWTATIAAAISTGKPIFCGGAQYKVSKQGSAVLPWDATSHPYVFKVTAPIAVFGPGAFIIDITDANTANVFLFQSVTGALLRDVTFEGVGAQATIKLYSGAGVVFDRCEDSWTFSQSSTNMRGNTLCFQSSNCGAISGISAVPQPNNSGSHFAGYSSSYITFRDCVGYGGTHDGDIVHFGSPGTGNRIDTCSVYAYVVGDVTKTIGFTDAQGLLLDSGQDFGMITNSYAYGYYYGIDIKTTGEGNLAEGNTIEKCKIGIAARRGEGDADTWNTKILGNMIRPLGGNGSAAAIPGCSLSKVAGIYIQDSPGTTVENNLIEASYLFGAGEQDFISVIGSFPDTTLVYSSIDGPWIRNNQFMQVMNIGGIYTYSKNVAVYIVGNATAPLRRGSISGNDFKLFADTPIQYYPLSITYPVQFSINDNHFSIQKGAYCDIYVNQGEMVTLCNNTFDISAGFIRVANSDKVTVRGNIFSVEVRSSATALPVAAIYCDTCTNVLVDANIQRQGNNSYSAGNDDGYFFETSGTGNINIVLSNNILTKILFLPYFYAVDGTAGNIRQDISVSGNVLNGVLAIGTELCSRTWGIRADGAGTGKWIVDGVAGAAIAAAHSQDIDILTSLQPMGKIVLVNFSTVQKFNHSPMKGGMGDQSGTSTWYVGSLYDLTAANATGFTDYIPLNCSVNESGSNLTVNVATDVNLSTLALTGAFTVTVSWIQMTGPTYSV